MVVVAGLCSACSQDTSQTADVNQNLTRQPPSPQKRMGSHAPSRIVAGGPGLEDDQIAADTLLEVNPSTGASNVSDGGGVLGRQASGNTLGIDTLPNFTSTFYFPGIIESLYGDFAQYTWAYTMMGRPPFGQSSSEHTTVIDAPIIPVIVDLRNADGSPRFLPGPNGTQIPMILDGTQYVDPVLKSPIFQNTKYSSSERGTQFPDAVHRAQFFRMAEDDWHTRLNPVVKPARRLVLIRGTYRFSADATGHLRFVMVDQNAFANAMFPPTPDDTSTLVGGAENSGDMKTTDMTTFLFPDTYLGDVSTGDCCVLGFHTYDVEPGNAVNNWREKHYVMNYSSWITPGLFGGGFSDITALSHEISETFSDPFVANATPIWLAPNGLCQANLESGDVIEGLANATYPMTMNGYTYHPQNEALLQWFAGQSPSSAIGHAYSYPDQTVVTSAAVSQAPGCSGPASFARTRP